MEIFVIILLIVFLLSAIFSVVYDGKVAEISSEIHKYSVIALSAVCVCGIIRISSPQACLRMWYNQNKFPTSNRCLSWKNDT